jgi:hypothetical protein
MMMGFNGFNFPPNGYFNPQPPRRLPIQSIVPETILYQAVVNNGDAYQSDGTENPNADGKLDKAELNQLLNDLVLAGQQAKANFEATGNLNYQVMFNDAQAFSRIASNLQNQYATFANADPNGNGNITQQGIQNIANKDGNPYDVSSQDVGLQQLPAFYNQPPMNYGYPMPPYGQQPYYNNQPPYGGGSGYPFPVPYPVAPKPPEDLTYLQAKADNPNVWDGKQLAVGINNRIGQLDVNGDQQISYREAMASPDGLLGNGQLSFRPGSPESMRFWAGISGNDGKVNARELAATILSVDADSNGTVTNQETQAFATELVQRTDNPDMAARMYDYINEKGKRFGLDKFIAETQETKDVRTVASVSKQTEKTVLRNENIALNKTSEALMAKLKGLDPNSVEAKELNKQLIKTQVTAGFTRFVSILEMLKEGYPEDPAGFTAGGKAYKEQLSTIASDVKKKSEALDPNSAEAKKLKNVAAYFEAGAAQANQPRSYGSSNLLAEDQITIPNKLILQNQVLKQLDPNSEQAKSLKQSIETELDAYPYLPKADISKLSPEGKKLFTLGQDYMATAKQLQTADLTTPAGKALQAKLEMLEKDFIAASNFNPLPVVDPPPPTPALTATIAAQRLVDNFGAFESLLDTDKNRKDGIAQFNELVAYTQKADANPDVKAAAQFFIDNRTTTFNKMENLNDPSGKLDSIFSLEELKKFLAQQS